MNLNESLHILHFEDNPADIELIALEIKKHFDQYEIKVTNKIEECREWLSEQVFDVILTAYTISGVQEMESLKLFKEIAPYTPVIYVTRALGEELAVKALQEGATDYVLKKHLEKLPFAIRRAVEEARQKRKTEQSILALQDSERKYKKIFNSFIDVYYQLDLDYKIERISPSCFRTFGYRTEELIGQSIDIFFKKEGAFNHIQKETINHTEVRDIELIGRKKNKEIIYLSISASLRADQEGKNLGFYGVIRNITEKQSVLQEIKEAQENLIQAQKIANIGSYRFNVAKKKMEYWSDQMYNIFEFDPGEGIPSHEEFKKRLINPLNRKSLTDLVSYSENFLPYEQIYACKSGDTETRHIKETVRPQLDDQKRLVNVLGAVQDITEQKKAEQATEHSRTRLSAILKNTAEATLIVDKDCLVKYVSPAFERILGYWVVDVVGTSVEGYISKDERKDFQTILSKVEEGESSGFKIFHFYTDKGAQRCMRVNATNMLNNDFIKGFILSAQDITELEDAYSNLNRAHQDALKYQSRLLSSQLNPHFIFNALNSIQYYILENNQELTLHYLSAFSGLMRQTLNNSNLDFLSLSEELQFLRNYVELENNRFLEKFDYKIELDENIDPDSVCVPPMFIQPHIENAIIHGIGNKSEKGKLRIRFYIQDEKQLICSITDDGVGRQKAMELRSLRSGAIHQPMVMSLTATRLNILNQLEGEEFDVIVNDLIEPEGEIKGTEVLIRMPLIDDI
ncbi:MAG: PAS domain S-box protein [Crocinitomicaceae bacterium]